VASRRNALFERDSSARADGDVAAGRDAADPCIQAANVQGPGIADIDAACAAVGFELVHVQQQRRTRASDAGPSLNRQRVGRDHHAGVGRYGARGNDNYAMAWRVDVRVDDIVAHYIDEDV